MATLRTVDKIKLEKILEMGGGYVLDFSNRTFQEFILENLNMDIYDDRYDYASGSKANRLRAFWKIEDDNTVGILIEELLEYWKTQRIIDGQSISNSERNLADECFAIAARLKKTKSEAQDDTINVRADIQETFNQQQSILLKKFEEFSLLSKPEDKRRRGLLLEDLLKHIFDLYQIPVRSSFMRNEGGEQIDGAFKLDGWCYLVECKWTQKLTDIRQLDSLYGKVSRSGKQTLGLFISINGWSENVCPLLRQNQDKSIILMDGFDLRCTLSSHTSINLKDLLTSKSDCLNFEGQPFYSASEYLKKS